MPVQNDARILLFFIREFAIMVDVGESNNLSVGFLSATILQDLRMHTQWIVLAQPGGDLDGAMGSGIVLYESAEETNDNRWRRNRRGHGDRNSCIAPHDRWDHSGEQTNTAKDDLN